MIDKDRNQWIPEQKQQKHDFDKSVRETLVFITNELECVDRLPFAVKKNKSKSTDKETYNKLMTGTEESFRMIGAQRHTLFSN